MSEVSTATMKFNVDEIWCRMRDEFFAHVKTCRQCRDESEECGPGFCEEGKRLHEPMEKHRLAAVASDRSKKKEATKLAKAQEDLNLRAGLYRHYGGGIYQVFGIGAHSETDERFVIYTSLTMLPGPRMRVRPIDLWNNKVKWPDGKIRPRFIYIGAELPEPPEK